MTQPRSPRAEAASFAKRLIELMEAREMTIRRAAEIAKVSPSTVMSWRSGAAPLNYRAVKRLAEGLGSSLSYLLTGECDAHPECGAHPLRQAFEGQEVLFKGFARITIHRLISSRTEKRLNPPEGHKAPRQKGAQG
jgi:transcriptional regulator with XRE-family HTH domain